LISEYTDGNTIRSKISRTAGPINQSGSKDRRQVRGRGLVEVKDWLAGS
jgi:hypothetical protein